MIFEVKMFYTFGKEQVSIVYVKRRPCWCTEVVHQDGRRIQINQNVQIFIFELLVNKASYWIQNMPVCSFLSAVQDLLYSLPIKWLDMFV